MTKAEALAAMRRLTETLTLFAERSEPQQQRRVLATLQAVWIATSALLDATHIHDPTLLNKEQRTRFDKLLRLAIGETPGLFTAGPGKDTSK